MSTRIKILIIVLALVIAAAAYWFLKKPSLASQTANNSAPMPESGNGIPRVIANDNFPLQLGSAGQNVRYLQNALNKIRPLNKLVLDGVLGANTRQALLITVDTKRSALPMSQVNFNSILAQANKV